MNIGLYTTIERMYPDVQTRVRIDAQLEKFKRAEGMFGMDMAILTRETKQPGNLLWIDENYKLTNIIVFFRT